MEFLKKMIGPMFFECDGFGALAEISFKIDFSMQSKMNGFL